MEMKYTNTSAEIVFLKDADIIQDFNLTTISGNEVSVNGIPSYTFFKLRNDSIVTSVDNLCIDMKLSVNTLLSGDMTYTGSNTYSKELSAANISVLNGNIANLTATNVSMSNVGISDLTATNETVTNLTATNSELSNVGISILTATNETVTNLTATNSELSNVSISSLTATNETVTDLTATNVSMSNVGISDLTATNETVTNLTATKLSVSEVDLSVVGVSSLVVSDLSAKDVKLVATNISDLTATTASITTETATALTVTDKINAAVISASVLSIINDSVSQEGGHTHLSIDGTGVYIDLSSSNVHSIDRKVKLQLPHNISDIEINNKSLSSYIHDEAELCSTACKQFTTDSINELDKTTSIANGKIISSIEETNGIVTATVRDLLQSDVSNLTTDLANISADYVKHAGDEIAYLSVKTDLSTKNLYVTNNVFDSTLNKTFKSNISADEKGIVVELNGNTRKLCVNYDNTINGIDGIVVNSKTLTEHVHDKISADFTTFEYLSTEHAIKMLLADKVLSIDTIDFIRNRVVTHVEIENGSTPEPTPVTYKNLIIWFTNKWETPEARLLAKEGTDYIKIDIKSLTQVYKFSNGVSSDGYLNVEVDSTIPRLTNLTANDIFDDSKRHGYTISSLTESNGVISYGICRLTSADVENLEDFVKDSISANYDKVSAEISAVSSDLQNQIVSNDNDIKYLSAEISALSNEVSSLSDQVAFISAGLSSDLSIAQNDISTKIWIKDSTTAAIDTKYKAGAYSDLSIIKLDIEEYKNIVANNPTLLSDDKLYVVDSDYIEAYGQVISNLTMTNDLTESEATNKHYVDTTINAISTDLKNQITSNDSDIDYLSGVVRNNISATLATLSTDYSNTLSAIDRKTNTHIKSDNLIVTDPINHKAGTVDQHIQYYLTFLSGTMVLKKM